LRPGAGRSERLPVHDSASRTQACDRIPAIRRSQPQAALANQALAASFFRSFLAAATGKTPSAASAKQLHKAALGVLGKGFAPVHRKAVANAKRLSRTKLR